MLCRVFCAPGSAHTHSASHKHTRSVNDWLSEWKLYLGALLCDNNNNNSNNNVMRHVIPDELVLLVDFLLFLVLIYVTWDETVTRTAYKIDDRTAQSDCVDTRHDTVPCRLYTVLYTSLQSRSSPRCRDLRLIFSERLNYSFFHRLNLRISTSSSNSSNGIRRRIGTTSLDHSVLLASFVHSQQWFVRHRGSSNPSRHRL